ncbi:hypothetical protein T492DRAFT_857565 [Pavlovales sp. CCMP2436]|nr:hypothetical protein T492DRAFT_857565 [Pavlovales sp. CCMP2436]
MLDVPGSAPWPWLALAWRWALAALALARGRSPRRRCAPAAQAAPLPPMVRREGTRLELLVVDGCNLPLSLQLRDDGQRLVSHVDGRKEDWSMLLAATAGEEPRPFSRALVLFDGHSATGRVLADRTVELGSAVSASATANGQTADDAIVLLVARHHAGQGASARELTAHEALARLRGSREEQAQSRPSRWYVVRRTGGGERAYARLWRRLGLVRVEACAALLPVTASLRAQALVDAAHLAAAGAGGFVAVDEREAEPLRMVVATDDVLLARRVMDAGGASLTWRQLRALCGCD